MMPSYSLYEGSLVSKVLLSYVCEHVLILKLVRGRATYSVISFTLINYGWISLNLIVADILSSNILIRFLWSTDEYKCVIRSEYPSIWAGSSNLRSLRPKLHCFPILSLDSATCAESQWRSECGIRVSNREACLCGKVLR